MATEGAADDLDAAGRRALFWLRARARTKLRAMADDERREVTTRMAKWMKEAVPRVRGTTFEEVARGPDVSETMVKALDALAWLIEATIAETGKDPTDDAEGATSSLDQMFERVAGGGRRS